ncbi:uncharacterized protein BCR38DRAFT_525065 [Pseudomassariella vexata]|uniref:Uncharacterized protein n=1 Tax=Pseudomassariella vexata TaxID=1141098 RepID=A0A1Y2DW98_9PEZI|nr:uncharacterized protein BCR38DRAFT_525065 [Pseudomassariella vexata]ORY63527.1 hypothetical protein BCR38DRAFT_525065 [Pseudomassariella vexata]
MLMAPLQEAIESGLFGRLGEERIVLVDAADSERKRKFQNFSEVHGSGQDRQTAHFFQVYGKAESWVHDNMDELRIRWFMHMWRKTGKEAIEDYEGVWAERPDGDEDWDEEPYLRQHWVLNQDHPWVKDFFKSMPEIRPTVTFRLCIQNCA